MGQRFMNIDTTYGGTMHHAYILSIFQHMFIFVSIIIDKPLFSPWYTHLYVYIYSYIHRYTVYTLSSFRILMVSAKGILVDFNLFKIQTGMNAGHSIIQMSSCAEYCTHANVFIKVKTQGEDTYKVCQVKTLTKCLYECC